MFSDGEYKKHVRDLGDDYLSRAPRPSRNSLSVKLSVPLRSLGPSNGHGPTLASHLSPSMDAGQDEASESSHSSLAITTRAPITKATRRLRLLANAEATRQRIEAREGYARMDAFVRIHEGLARLRQLKTPRELIDAAHDKDTVRQLVVQQTQRSATGAQRLARVRTWAADPTAHATLTNEVREIVHTSELARDVVRLIQTPMLLDDSERDQIQGRLDQALAGQAGLADIAERIFADLVAIGRDPAGPAGKLLAGRCQWWEAYDWPPDHEQRPPRPRTDDPAAAAYIGQVRDRVRAQLAEALHSGAGRDIESLGIGFAVPAASHPIIAPEHLLPTAIAEQVVWGALRKLGTQRYYQGGRQDRDPLDTPPRALTGWLNRVAEEHATDPADLRAWAAAELPHNDQPVPRWVLDL